MRADVVSLVEKAGDLLTFRAMRERRPGSIRIYLHADGHDWYARYWIRKDRGAFDSAAFERDPVACLLGVLVAPDASPPPMEAGHWSRPEILQDYLAWSTHDRDVAADLFVEDLT